MIIDPFHQNGPESFFDGNVSPGFPLYFTGQTIEIYQHDSPLERHLGRSADGVEYQVEQMSCATKTPVLDGLLDNMAC